MKILLSSNYFYPSLGGSETDAEIFAREFVAQGHDVRVITQTPGTSFDDTGCLFPFEVIRSPSSGHLVSLLSWCDVCFQNGIILRQGWAVLLTRTPWVIRHQTWIQQPGQKSTWLIRLKFFALRFATSISISEAITDHLPLPSIVVPNPYRQGQFCLLPEVERTEELVFLGRLVSDKGVDLLLQAMANLKECGLTPKLTVIGSGEEAENLQLQAKSLGISNQVSFVGPKRGDNLVKLLNQHKILVVPSRWHEPLGVVALEGIACGCVVVASEGGGLKEAVGPCGVTFPNGDAQALTKVLKNLLIDPKPWEDYRAAAASHLARHDTQKVIRAYLDVIEAAVH